MIATVLLTSTGDWNLTPAFINLSRRAVRWSLAQLYSLCSQITCVGVSSCALVREWKLCIRFYKQVHGYERKLSVCNLHTKEKQAAGEGRRDSPVDHQITIITELIAMLSTWPCLIGVQNYTVTICHNNYVKAEIHLFAVLHKTPVGA